MAKAPKTKDGAVKQAAPPAEGYVSIVAHRNLLVDGEAFAEGETGDIRAELLDALVACGAVSVIEGAA